jgi:2-(1,2-epoxy-1,2-dihydrophenyl)acetyl-CoA isomerase
MCLTGRLFEASEFERSLVNRVVAHDDLLDESLAIAAEIAANPSPSLRMIKELLTRNGTCDDIAAVGHREHEALAAAYRTPEHREAVAAFMEKRPPDFRAAAKGAG